MTKSRIFSEFDSMRLESNPWKTANLQFEERLFQLSIMLGVWNGFLQQLKTQHY
jgi:hypothetical protein